MGALALGAGTYALITAADAPQPGPMIAAVIITLAAATAFLRRQATASAPMVPLSLFKNRTFSVINAMTFGVYAGLSGVMFFLVIHLQVSLGWSPLAAGLSSLPITLLMLLLSGRSADLATRVGVRLPLVAGSVIGGIGTALLTTASPGAGYVTAVLPGMILLGIGLVILVPTLTATVMSSAPAELAGVASGVNNGVSRAAGLMAVAAIPAAVGLAGSSYADPELMTAAFRGAMLICAGLLVAGGALAALLLPRPGAKLDHDTTDGAGETAAPCPAPGLPPSHGR